MTDKNINPLRGQQDPGWNDPPVVPYNTATVPNKLKLNKRIAFPLQGPKPTAIVQPQSTVPRPPLAPIPAAQPAIAIVHPMNSPSVPQAIRERNTFVATDLDLMILPEDAREYCLSIFRQQIVNIPADVDGDCSSDYRNRIDEMEQEWKDGKLNMAIQTTLYQISKALGEKDYKEAKKNYKTLMSHHSASVADWSAIIMKIISTYPS